MASDVAPKESLADIAAGFSIKADPTDRPDSETKGWNDDERGSSIRAEGKRTLRAFIMGNLGGHQL